MGHGKFRGWAAKKKDPLHSLVATLRFDIPRDASLWLRQSLGAPGLASETWEPCAVAITPMTEFEKLRCVLTDSHFLIPLIVFGIGLALLITLH